jgi:hypothetical protein
MFSLHLVIYTHTHTHTFALNTGHVLYQGTYSPPPATSEPAPTSAPSIGCPL